MMSKQNDESEAVLLRVDGEVAAPLALTFADFEAFLAAERVDDVSQVDSQRRGSAVRLAALLARVGPAAGVRYLTLHSASDNFHASIPLEPVRERGLLIYRLPDGPLPTKMGGPIRFLIPEFAACHTHEIDECANVKFVDRIELTAQPGFDNRPHDDKSHADLHAKE